MVYGSNNSNQSQAGMQHHHAGLLVSFFLASLLILVTGFSASAQNRNVRWSAGNGAPSGPCLGGPVNESAYVQVDSTPPTIYFGRGNPCSWIPSSAASAIVDVGFGNGNVFQDEFSGNTTTSITIGQTVLWKWVNGTHTVVSLSAHCNANPCSGLENGVFDSGSPSSVVGHVFGFTFTTAGTYNYYCDVHGQVMQGSVVVAAGGGGGGASPLTTKGDLFTHSTVDARLPVGIDGQIVSADSSQATGLKWINNSAGALQSATVTLTSAQIKNLVAAPVQIVAAPGVGKFISAISVAADLKFVSQRYNAGPTQASNINIIYGTDITTLAQSLSGGLFTATQSQIDSEGDGAGPTTQNRTLLENQPVNIAGTGTSDFVGGPIATSSLNAGGLGYAVNDTGTISAGNTDATYVIDTVGALGVVLTYHLTANGTGTYNVAANVATATGGGQPGAGTGFTIDINTVTTGDGTLKITLYYTIETLQP